MIGRDRSRANRVSSRERKLESFVPRGESRHRTAARFELEQSRRESFHGVGYYRHEASGADKSNKVNNGENFELLWRRESSDIECLNGGVASGGCVRRYKGVEPGSRQLGGVQLVAAILVMYPWGCVKVLSAKRATLHSAFYTFALR